MPRSRMLGVPAQHLVRRKVTAPPEDLEIRMRVGAECEPEHEALYALIDCVAGKGLEHEAVAARRSVDIRHVSDGADLQRERRDLERDPDGPECARLDNDVGRELYLDAKIRRRGRARRSSRCPAPMRSPAPHDRKPTAAPAWANPGRR